jgi:hypothetical protein
MRVAFSHFAKGRQHNSPTFSLEISRDEHKLLAAHIRIASRHLNFPRNSDRGDEACVQRIIAHGTLGRPAAAKKNLGGILQPRCFGLLDSLKVVGPELFPPVTNVDVVAEGAIAPGNVGTLGLLAIATARRAAKQILLGNIRTAVKGVHSGAMALLELISG